MNIIITSELRVGSRWLHYLLKDLLGMKVSGEIDTTKMVSFNGKIGRYFREGRIVKLHHALPRNITDVIKPINYKIIGVVRNPRDRAISRTFHRKYNKEGSDCEPHFNDVQAVQYTIMESEEFKAYTKNQFDFMLDGYATRSKTLSKLPYIWTSYAWLLHDTAREVRAICDFLGTSYTKKRIQQVVTQNSFETKSNRKPGNEQRKDLWRRKGIMADWVNWFTEGMVNYTAEEQERYWRTLMRNSGRG